MPFSPPAALTTEAGKLTFLQSMIAAIKTSFNHGMTGADLTYPWILGGPIDFGRYQLQGLAQFSGVIFASAYATLQAAINAVPASGGAVILEPKTYDLTSTLDMSKVDTLNNVVLVGQGQVTTIRATTGFASTPLVKMSDGSGAKRTFMGIFNCTIDCGGRTTGLSMENTADSWCKNVHFINGNGQEYINISTATAGTISGCKLDDTVGMVRYLIYRSSGTATPTDKNWCIRNNYLYTVNDAGGNIILSNCPEYSLIYGNDIFTQGDGIYIGSTSSSNIYMVTVAGNSISGTSELAPCNNGIVVQTNTGLGRNIVVVDNQIRYADTGIYLNAPTTGAAMRVVNISGNHMIRIGGSGIFLGGWVYHINTTDNVIYMLNTLGGTNGGIYLLPGGATTHRHHNIVGNTIINLGTSGLTNGILANDTNITKSLASYNFVKGTLGISIGAGTLAAENIVDALLESAV